MIALDLTARLGAGHVVQLADHLEVTEDAEGSSRSAGAQGRAYVERTTPLRGGPRSDAR